MIENYTLARPYAKAIFAVALAHNNLAAWSRFLQDSTQILEDFKRAYAVFNFGLSRKQRAEILTTIENTFVDQQQENLIKLLLRRKKLRLLPEISLLYATLRAAHEGVLTVKVQSAISLTAAYQQKLAAVLQRKFGRHIVFDLAVNPSLIGGAIISVGDLVIDGSALGMLDRLRQRCA